MVRKRIQLLLVSLLVLISATCVKEQQTADNMHNTLDPRIEELGVLLEEIQTVHPTLLTHISEEDFERKKTTFLAQNSGASDLELFFGLSEILALAKDGHTSAYMTKRGNLSASQRLPFWIDCFEDGYYLIALDVKYKAYLGAKLVQINRTSIDTLFTLSGNIISAENSYWHMMQFLQMIFDVSFLEYIGVKENDSPLTLTVETTTGACETFSVDSVLETDIHLSDLAFLQENIPIAKKRKSDFYWSEELTSDTYYIGYNICDEDPDFPVSVFEETIRQALTYGAYRKVIFDLRYNSGGMHDVMVSFFDMLQAMQESQGFHMYALVGRETFSRGVLAAIDISEQLEATFVGTPTGGSVAKGLVQYYHMTTMPMVVSYSVAYWPLQTAGDGSTFQPDIHITHSVEDYKQGIDPEVEWVLQQEP